MHKLACLILATVIATSTPAMAQSSIPAPAIDHHQHLMSPALSDFVGRAPLPAIDVPDDIKTLLDARAANTQDTAALTPLFIEDATFLTLQGWVRNREEAVGFITRVFSPGYRIAPVAFSRSGNTATVAGYYVRGEGDTLRRPGYFTMTLVRQRGRWLIASETPVFPGPRAEPVIDSDRLIQMMDEAGMRRAIVLSNAYSFDGVLSDDQDHYAQVRAENDWVATQVARHADRLTAFCSFNPLADYAVAELERCAQNPSFTGVKLHFGTSGIDIRNPAQAEHVRTVFAAANRLRMPILVHLTASLDYGRAHAEAFVQNVLPAAPDVTVIIGHLWGGAGYSDDALAVYAEAIASRNPAARNLYFEVAQISMVEGNNDEHVRQIVARMRQIGFDRILYGSDGVSFNGMPPRLVWGDFRAKMPLTDSEFRQIATNVAPFLH